MAAQWIVLPFSFEEQTSHYITLLCPTAFMEFYEEIRYYCLLLVNLHAFFLSFSFFFFLSIEILLRKDGTVIQYLLISTIRNIYVEAQFQRKEFCFSKSHIQSSLVQIFGSCAFKLANEESENWKVLSAYTGSYFIKIQRRHTMNNPAS